MVISSYDPSYRYKRRSAERLRSLLTFWGVVLLVGGLGFWLGGIMSEQNLLALEKQVESFEAQHKEFEAALTEANAEAQTAITRYQDLEQAVSEVVSEGPMQELLVVLKAQLDKGVDAKRLMAAVETTRPPENCSVPALRRFVVKTPTYKGPQSQVELAKGALKIHGTGESSRNDVGAPQAWFDPSKPIKVSFEVDGEGVKSKTAVMPFFQSIVIGDEEYRMSIEAGAQSFAQVRFDVCDRADKS